MMKNFCYKCVGLVTADRIQNFRNWKIPAQSLTPRQKHTICMIQREKYHQQTIMQATSLSLNWHWVEQCAKILQDEKDTLGLL